jgi:hypothetical protein
VVDAVCLVFGAVVVDCVCVVVGAVVVESPHAVTVAANAARRRSRAASPRVFVPSRPMMNLDGAAIFRGPLERSGLVCR